MEERRVELRALNTCVKESRASVEGNKSKLDPNVKKTTGLVKKVKALSEENAAQIGQEIVKLNLKRYVSEIVTGILEAPLKMKDIPAVVEVISLMHQRYDSFTAPFSKGLFVSLENIESSTESKDIARRRILIRLIGELVLVGIIDSPGIALKSLRKLTLIASRDDKTKDDVVIASPLALSNLTGICGFIRAIGSEFTGIGTEPALVVPSEIQVRYLAMFRAYALSVFERVKKEHELLHLKQKRAREEMMNRGSLSEKTTDTLEQRESELSKLKIGADSLAELLGMDSLVLEEAEEEGKDIGGIALWDNRRGNVEEEEMSSETWAYGDEETKNFYCGIPDLNVLLPQGLFHAAPKKQNESENKVRYMPTAPETVSRGTLDNALEQLSGKPGKPVHTVAFAETAPIEEVECEDAVQEDEEYFDEQEDDEEVGVGASVEVDEMMNHLKNVLSMSAADKFSLDFCRVSNKKVISRLISELARAPWSRCELLPYYSRIAVTLSNVFPQIGKGLMEYLEREFRGLLRRNDNKRLESRLRNVRYIAELVKFNQGDFAPPEKAFYVLTTCFKDFSGQNIDCVCALLEGCGRYLYRLEETHKETARFLEVLMRHKMMRNLSPAYCTMVDNAFYFIIPPQNGGKRKVKRVKSNEELFVRYLLFEYMDSELPCDNFSAKVQEKEEPINAVKRRKSKSAMENDKLIVIVKMLNKLNWSLAETADLVTKSFISAVKKRNHVTPKLCECLISFPTIAVQIEDNILACIEMALDFNDYRDYQKQLSFARMFADMFCYKMVDANTLFDTLYFIIQYGHSTQQSDTNERLVCPRGPSNCIENDASTFHPRVPFIHDPPHECFRLRLVCTILDPVCEFLKKGPLQPRLKKFLVYLERYILSKSYVPLAMEYVLQDTFEKMNVTRASISWEEANEKVAQLEREASVMQTISESDIEEYESEIVSEEEEEESDDEDIEEEEEDDDDDDESIEEEENFSEEDSDSYLNQRTAEDEAFEQEFAKLMQDTMRSAKPSNAKTVNVDKMSIPRHLFAKDDAPPVDGVVAFKLLKRVKGGKTGTATINVPEGSKIAKGIQKDKEEKELEIQLLKRRLVEFEHREKELH